MTELELITENEDDRTRFNHSVARPLPSQQQSPGLLHLDRFEPYIFIVHQAKNPHLSVWVLLGGRILVKFELRKASISCRVKVSVPSL